MESKEEILDKLTNNNKSIYSIIGNIPESLMHDKDIVMKVMEYAGYMFETLPIEMRSDKDVIRKACCYDIKSYNVMCCFQPFSHIPESVLREDYTREEIIQDIFRDGSPTLNGSPEYIHDDIEFVIEAIISDDYNHHYMSQRIIELLKEEGFELKTHSENANELNDDDVSGSGNLYKKSRIGIIKLLRILLDRERNQSRIKSARK